MVAVCHDSSTVVTVTVVVVATVVVVIIILVGCNHHHRCTLLWFVLFRRIATWRHGGGLLVRNLFIETALMGQTGTALNRKRPHDDSSYDSSSSSYRAQRETTEEEEDEEDTRPTQVVSCPERGSPTPPPQQRTHARTDARTNYRYVSVVCSARDDDVTLMLCCWIEYSTNSLLAY